MVRVEDLVFLCLEAGDLRDQRADELARQHPEHADAMRQMLADLRRIGFMDGPGVAVRPATAWPTAVGGYTLGELIGRGGMGLVFAARQRSLGDRKVAVKMIRPEFVADIRAEARFLREAMLASRLDHPALCPVLDFGRAEGQAFLVMPFVDGRSLSALLNEARQQHATDPGYRLELPGTAGGGPWWGAILELVEKLARGLHHAHEAGMVHRDIKPANVMVRGNGDPVVLDFGLARQTDQDGELTLSGDLVGTPAYMAPEQIEPRGRRIDARTDVYALGVLCYECLALCLPHEATTRDELIRRIVAEPPSDPGRRGVDLPRDLRTVLSVALAKEPGARYATALLLAEDLQRVRARLPIVARRPGLSALTLRWVQRNPWPTAAGCLLGGGLLIALLLNARIRRQETEARALALIGRSAAAAEVDQSVALHLARAAADLAPERLEVADQLHKAARGMHELAIVDGFVGGVAATGFAADGRTFAVGNDGTLVVGDRDGKVTSRSSLGAAIELAQALPTDGIAVVLAAAAGNLHLWRPDAMPPLQRLGPDLGAPAGALTYGGRLCVSRDGQRLLVGTRRGRVVVLALPGGEVLREITVTAPFGCGAFAGDGLLLADRGGRVAWWRDGDAPEQTFSHPNGLVERLVVDASGSRFCAMALGGASLLAGKLHTGEHQLLEWQLLGLRELVGSSDGETFASGANDGAVGIWRFGDGWPRRLLRGHRGPVTALAFAGDGRHLVSGAEDRQVRVWDLHGRCLATLVGHQARTAAVAIDATAARMLSGSADATTRLWRLADGLPAVEQPRRAAESFGRFVFGADPEVAWIGDAMTGTLWRVDWRTGAIAALDESTTDATCLQIDVDAACQRLLVGRQNAVELRDATTGVLLDRLDRAPIAIVGSDLFDDGKHAIIIEQGGGARAPRLLRLDITDDRLVVVHERELDAWDRRQPYLNRADLGGDERTVIVCRMDGTARLYDLDGEPRSPELDHGRERNLAPYRGTLSRDGNRLLTAGTDGIVKLWQRTATGFVARDLTSFGVRVRSAYFDRQERRVVAGSDDGMLRVLDLDGRVLAQFDHAGTAIHCARFSPDDRHVVATTRDGRMLHWLLDREELRRVVDRLQIRDLRPVERAAHADLLGAR